MTGVNPTAQMKRTLGKAFQSLLEGNGWEKLSTPSVTRGATAVPRNPSAFERIGLRLDYDGTVDRADGKYHKFELQVNAGKIPSAFSRWKNEQSSGTHSVMAKVEIKDGATKAEIEAALKEATKDVKGV